MEKKFNVVIVSKKVSEDVLYCLNKLNHQRYKNFFVTVVVDAKYKKRIPKYKFKTNIVVSKNKNMSYKRNIGVSMFNSELIAFLDSDAYPPKNWLLNGRKLLSNNKKLILGGPSIPFPNQKYWEMIAYYAKRSFFVTGYLNFRKYKSPDRYCDWVESCNMLMHRELFIKNKGMNKNIYLGEDKELIERMKKNDNYIQVYFSKKLFIYHSERTLSKFLIQRFIFGTDLFNIIKFQNKIQSFQPILPLTILIVFAILIFLKIEFSFKLILVSLFIFSIQSIIFLDIIKYLNNPLKIIHTIIAINLANISYALGNFFEFFFLKKFLDRKMYLYSREKDIKIKN